MRFSVWKCFPVGKRFLLEMPFQVGKHFPWTTIWGNSSQRRQNKETLPEGNLLEFCEIFTPAVDTKAQVDFVKEKHPGSYLAMVGISAGSGLLFTYLGKEGKNTPVRAAAALCPAYDIN
jgi:hypothetical protein